MMPQWSKGTKRSTSPSMKPSNSKSATRASNPKRFPPPTPSEQAFEAALAALADSARDEPDRASHGVIDRLFARSGEYLSDPYSTIGDASRFHTKLAGVSFEGRQDVIAGLRDGVDLRLMRQADNPYDRNAIAVHYGQLQLGFISKGIAAHIAPLIDAGASYRARVASLTGGTSEKHRGVNVLVERIGVAAAPQRDAALLPLAETGDPELGSRVTGALLGACAPHAAQKAVLERLEAGRNTLAVFATGRGKSFCFQYTAAMRALTEVARRWSSIRCARWRTISSKRCAARSTRLGCVFSAQTARSITKNEKSSLPRCATGRGTSCWPRRSFWNFTATRSAPTACRRCWFSTKRTICTSRATARPTRDCPRRLPRLGDPQVLALTATAGDECFTRICQELRIDGWVIDPTVRDNLHVVDARNTKDKLAYLKDLFTGEKGEKGIVYCYSRTEVTKVARALRKPLDDAVMFYHGKMPNADRLEVERLFRDGTLRVVVATSAFGEGIDLPDVRNVVIYHLNFDAGEFNQQAGRAGRDGTAGPHPLALWPSRQEPQRISDRPRIAAARAAARNLSRLARPWERRHRAVELQRYSENAGIDGVRDSTIAAALRIFEDCALAEIGEDDEGRFVRLLPARDKIDMAANERFAEGEAIRDAFAKFYELALHASAEMLERVINRPIYPSRVALEK